MVCIRDVESAMTTPRMGTLRAERLRCLAAALELVTDGLADAVGKPEPPDVEVLEGMLVTLTNCQRIVGELGEVA